MSLKQPAEPTSAIRAPALVALQQRFRRLQDNEVMQNSPAVVEMKQARK